MNIFDLQATISLNGDAFMSGVQNASTAFNGLGQTVSAKAIALGTAVGNMATKAASSVVDFGKDSIKTGMDFESAMSQVAATLGLSMDDIKANLNGAGDTFEALKNTAAVMGRETVFSASEAAEGLNILAMSGFSAQKSIEMLPDVLNLAAAGSMSLSEAASYISGNIKGFADETKGANYYSNLMAKGATLANTSVAQLGEAMSAGAAGAAAYSQTADSMTIALLRLAEQNEVGSAAGTALAAAMKNLYTPTDQAKQALEELGVAAYKNGKALDFNDIVNNLSNALSVFSEEEANAYKQTIFGIQGLNAFNKMTVTSTEKQLEWNAALSQAQDGIGEAAQQYQTMTDNLEGGLAGLNSALEGFRNAVYEKMATPLQEAATVGADALNTITRGFEEGGIKGAISALGDFAKEKLSGIWDNLKLPPELDGISKFFEDLLGSVKPVVETFSGADGVSGKIQEFAGAIQSFLKAFIDAKLDTIRSVAEVTKDFIDGFADSGAVSSISEFASNIGDLFQKFLTVSADVVQKMASAVGRFLDGFDGFEVGKGFGDFVASVGDLFSAISTVAADTVEKSADAIGKIIDSADIESMGKGASDLIVFLEGLAENTSSAIASNIENTGESMSTFGSKVAGLAASFGPSLSSLVSALSGFLGEMASMAAAIEQAFAPVREFFGNTILTLLGHAVSAIGTLINGIISIFSNWLSYMTGAIHAIRQLFEGDLVGAFNTVSDMFHSWVAEISAGFSSIVQTASGLVGQMYNAGYNLISGFWNGMKAVWESAKSWVSDAFGGLVSLVSGIFDSHSPSRVFMDIGKNLIVGFENGWEGEFGDLERTVANDMNGLTQTARIGFEGSAIGKSSAAGISSMLAAGEFGGRSGDPVEINLVLDGDVAATALYDPLRRVAWQKGRGEEVAYA